MDVTNLGPHISRRFNEDLEGVRSRVLQMGGFVEQQLAKGVQTDPHDAGRLVQNWIREA